MLSATYKIIISLTKLQANACFLEAANLFNSKHTLKQGLNFLTNHEQWRTLQNQLSASTGGTNEFFSALNIFLSITAAVSNVLILIAPRDVSSIHPLTKLFFRCLAVTDLCVGLIAQPLYATYIMSRITKMNANVLVYVNKAYAASSYSLCVLSAYTSTAISVDRLLALLLGLRYRHVVTLKRVHVVITCFWLIAASGGLLRVWRRDIAIKETSTVLILCLVTSIFCYTRIHLKLRHQQAQIHICYLPAGRSVS